MLFDVDNIRMGGWGGSSPAVRGERGGGGEGGREGGRKRKSERERGKGGGGREAERERGTEGQREEESKTRWGGRQLACVVQAGRVEALEVADPQAAHHILAAPGLVEG